METILEQQRRYHEERERLQDAMVKEMMYTNKTVRAVWLITTSDHIGPTWNSLRHLGTCYNNKNTFNQIVPAETTFL